jgi:hypothetical protein
MTMLQCREISNGIRKAGKRVAQRGWKLVRETLITMDTDNKESMSKLGYSVIASSY